MAVVTRSQTRAAAAAAGRGSSTTTTQNQVNAAIRENVVRGSSGNRASARGRGAKRAGAPTQGTRPTSSRTRATAASNSRNQNRRNTGKGKRATRPQAANQSTSTTCGLYFEFTFNHATTNNNCIAGPSRLTIEAAPLEEPVAPGKKTRTRASKAKAETSRPGQQNKESKGTGTAKAGAKRRHEDAEDQFEEIGTDEQNVDPAPRTLRRVRRKTERATQADAPVHDAVVETVNRTRRNKGKAKAVDLPSGEGAMVGSKRQRDEDDEDAGDVSQMPLDPGPSRRTTRRTRQKAERLEVVQPVRRSTRKLRTRQTVEAKVPPKRQGAKRSRKLVEPPRPSRASTPESCGLKEPTVSPPRVSSTLLSGVEKGPTPPREEATETVKQEELTPPPLLRHEPTEQVGCMEVKYSEAQSSVKLPEPSGRTPTTTEVAPDAEEARDDRMGDSAERAGDMLDSKTERAVANSGCSLTVVKEESISSSSSGAASSSSLGDSDKENMPSIPSNPLEYWSLSSPQFAVIGYLPEHSPEPIETGGSHTAGPAAGSNENGADRQNGNASHLLRLRRPLAPLLSFANPALERQDSEELESSSSCEDHAEPEYYGPGDYQRGYTYNSDEDDPRGVEGEQEHGFPEAGPSRPRVTVAPETVDYPYGYTFVDDDDDPRDDGYAPREHDVSVARPTGMLRPARFDHYDAGDHPSRYTFVGDGGDVESDDEEPQDYEFPGADRSGIRGATEHGRYGRRDYPYGYTFVDDDGVPQYGSPEAGPSRMRGNTEPEHYGYPYKYTLVSDDDSSQGDEDVPQRYDFPEDENPRIGGAVELGRYESENHRYGHAFVDDNDDDPEGSEDVPQEYDFPEPELVNLREAAEPRHHETRDYPYRYTFVDEDDGSEGDEGAQEYGSPEAGSSRMREAVELGRYEREDHPHGYNFVDDTEDEGEYDSQQAEGARIRRAAELERHGTEGYSFGYTFVGDDDDLEGDENASYEFPEAGPSQVRGAPRSVVYGAVATNNRNEFRGDNASPLSCVLLPSPFDP